ncbi:uncharacterized protein LOC125494684 [Beta vulgaris subsp. vulgaris]|uniref:uncharacterized protein LOC125494684 n=1 Tax=Beta vulgaris subsp. vulgaris TaxID=3555 RepID=UPI0020367B01|nr:uncharacterized protein LOC125494684 [Beta vulgaris subsp. vulgaris]
MAPYEAFYGRKCRNLACWSDISDSLVLGPDLIHDTVEQVKVIQATMKVAQDRQKSYEDLRRKPISYAVGDKLRRYHIDPSHVIPIESVAIEPNLTVEERPVQILDRQNRALRRKVIPMVKVLWKSQK